LNNTCSITYKPSQIYVKTYIQCSWCQFLEVFKGKPTKSIKIMPHLKLSKNMILGQFFWKMNKIATHMDLWKLGQILTIQNSLVIKRLKISKTIFFIWIYHLVLHYISSPNNKFGMWINIKFYILWCSSKMTNQYFSISKVHYY